MGKPCFFRGKATTNEPAPGKSWHAPSWSLWPLGGWFWFGSPENYGESTAGESTITGLVGGSFMFVYVRFTSLIFPNTWDG